VFGNRHGQPRTRHADPHRQQARSIARVKSSATMCSAMVGRLSHMPVITGGAGTSLLAGEPWRGRHAATSSQAASDAYGEPDPAHPRRRASTHRGSRFEGCELHRSIASR